MANLLSSSHCYRKKRVVAIVPIEPELYNILLEAFETAYEGEALVIAEGTIGKFNLWRDFGVICKRAGLKRWERWCQVLRKNCEKD
jgi:hypothetical protein